MWSKSHIQSACCLFLLLIQLRGFAQFSTSLPNTSSGRFSSREVNPYRVNPANTLLDSAQILAPQFPLRAIDKINKAIELSIENSDKNTEAYAYLVLGTLQQKLSQHEMAIDNFKKCISVLNYFPSRKSGKFINKPNPQSEARIYKARQQMAISLTELKKYGEAETIIAMCLNERPLAIAAFEDGESGRIQSEILKRQGKYAECEQTLLEILSKEKESQNIEGEIKTLVALGKSSESQKSLSKAADHYSQAKNLAEKYSKQNFLVQCNDMLAEIARQQKDVEKEVAIRNGNIALNTSNGDATSNIRQNYEISNAYMNTNQFEKAVPYLQKAYGDANSTASKIVFEATSSDAIDQSSDALRILTNEYLKKGEKEKALEYFNKYTLLQDSIRLLRKNELEQALSIGTSLGKNQQRIDLLEKERQLNVKSIEFLQKNQSLKEEQLGARNLIIGALVFCIVFLLIGGVFMSRSAAEKRKANQLLAIKSLRGQMNPHFIFNALNSVNHYISKNDERSANKYLSDFSKLMRSVMDSSKHDFIPLGEETETLKLYLELEHSRFRDKFDYTFRVDEKLSMQDFEIPPMIIQPYIENAVWHGLRYIEGKGLLEVNFSKEGPDLKVTVQDNGIGRKKSAEIKTRNQKTQKSEGTQNIENRIGIMNKLYGLNIRVQMSDAFPGTENCGTLVEISIPKKL